MLKKCPYCGRELPKSRRRLPSGFGQISEIKGKGLTKPFRAMVTVGRKEDYYTSGKTFLQLVPFLSPEYRYRIDKSYIQVYNVQSEK